MPDSLKHCVRVIDETVALDLRHPPPTASKPQALLRLGEAALARQRLHLHCRSAQQGGSERDFDVYGITFRDGCWCAVDPCVCVRACARFESTASPRCRPCPRVSADLKTPMRLPI